MRRRQFLGLSLAAFSSPLLARVDAIADSYWRQVFERMSPALRRLVEDPQHQVQLRCIRMERDAHGDVGLHSHDYAMVPSRWFAAASVAKLPMVLLVAERLSAHGLDAAASVRLDAAPATGEWSQEESLAGMFRRDIRRTFAVSDNVPFNRWYEWLGADAINTRLHALGYPTARLVARLGSTDRDANRRTGGGALLASDGTLVARLPAAVAQPRRFQSGAVFAGRGWQEDDGTVVPRAHDFSYGNFVALADSLRMLQAFVIPDSVPERQRWRIAGPLRDQLLHALALRPRDSGDPAYPERDYPDGHARWFFVGAGNDRYPDGLGVFGKSGMAYGYLSEIAYVVDRTGGAEFMLGAVIHANADGIYNDDRYEYDTVALPFLAALGRAVLKVEREAALIR